MRFSNRVTLCFVFIGFLYSCNSSNTFTVEGTVDTKSNGSTIFLRHENEQGEIVNIDSTAIHDGVFSFEGTATELDIYYLAIKGSNSGVSFIAEPGTIKVNFATTPTALTAVSGTPNNDQLQRFNATFIALDNQLFRFQSQNKTKYRKAVEAKDTVTINALMQTAFALNKKKMDYLLSFPAKNPKSFVSLLVLQQRAFSGDTAIQAIKNDFNRLDANLKATKIGASVLSRIKVLETSKSNQTNASLELGQPAPNFTAKDPDGKKIQLKNVLGKKVTVIDFWASWCNPCRRENPNMVKLYADLHNNGLNIVGVSLDEDATAWKKAIAKDGITWLQVSNLKGWKDPIALQYQVEEIPYTYVLDSQGKVVAKGLTGERLRQKIDALLNP